VARYSKRALDGNRPVASKTGTQGLNRTDNSDAWMVGYTPSLSTAVWMGKQGAAPIENAQGNIIYGSGLPGAIWQTFMNAVLEGTPEEPLPSKAVIKGNPGNSRAEETTQAPASTSSRAAETSARPTTSSAAPTTSTAPTTSAAPTTTTEQQQSTSRPTSAPSGPTCGFGNLPECGQQGIGPPGDD